MPIDVNAPFRRPLNAARSQTSARLNAGAGPQVPSVQPQRREPPPQGPLPVRPAPLHASNPWRHPPALLRAPAAGNLPAPHAAPLPYRQLASVPFRKATHDSVTCSICWLDLVDLREPVLVRTQAIEHVFEYSLLLQHWQQQGTNPMTCLPLALTEIYRIRRC